VKNKEELKEYQGDDRVISSFEMEQLIKERRKAGHNIQLKSGMSIIDGYLEGGFQQGELYIISGLTKHGKTLLAQTWTTSFIEQLSPPLWFTYEVPAAQFLSQFPTFPMVMMPRELKSMDMDWVEERIIESEIKNYTRAVFIDHLHFLFDMARSKSPSLEIGTVVRRLKRIAVEQEMIIFLLCHTTKVQKGEAITWRNLRDSSLVAQESDSVIIIGRTPDLGENTAFAEVCFHRRTGVMEKGVSLVKVKGLLEQKGNEPF
jgi:replicative DNA helicase